MATWSGSTLEDKRSALARAIHKIVIHPAAKGGNKFDTDRVDIRWRWDLYVKASDAEWERMTDEEREEAEVEVQRGYEAVAALESDDVAMARMERLSRLH